MAGVTWFEATVTDDGIVTVTDLTGETGEPEPFETVMRPTEEALGDLLLEVARIDSSARGSDYREELLKAFRFLVRSGEIGR